MVLSENLRKNNILVKVKSRNRWDLIKELIDNGVRNKDINTADREEILASLIEREKSMSTGIGNGVAIPHCSTPLVSRILLFMAICEKGIEFDSIDGLPAKIIILLIVPKNKFGQHIKTLAEIAKIMSDESFRNKLVSLKTPESICRLIKGGEN